MQSFTKNQLLAIYNYKCIKAREDFLTYRILINPKLKINWYVIDIISRKKQKVNKEDYFKIIFFINQH